MENITEYKKNFIEKNVQGVVKDLSGQMHSTEQVDVTGSIGDIDISLPVAISGIFDRLDQPILVVCDDNIEYINRAFLKFLGYSDNSRIVHEKLLKFVSQDDWNFVAENIGEILTHNGTIELRMLNVNYKVMKMVFNTVYVEDKQHFCFILIGKPVENKFSTNTLLYDERIGLPKFGLYEYNVQKAIDYENYKNPSLKRNKVVVCCVAIKNYISLKNDGQLDFILQRMSEKLLLSTNKLYTIAVGAKYPFWILMPDMQSDVEIQQEISSIQNLLNQPIGNNQFIYDISVAIGVSVYPNEAQSAKKLITQAEKAVSQALKDKQSKIVYFGS